MNLIKTGKFLEQNGYVERSVIFEEYMERLATICKSHGLTPMMWSDMYFRNSDPDRWYYNVGTKVPKTVRDKVTENVELVFWHYGEDEGGEWDYMYKYVATTLKYLAVKSEIAEKLKPAYMAGDKATLTHIKDVLFPELYELTEAVYLANKNAWMRDFKTLTAKILNARYGFMKERIKTAIEFLDMYLSGELDKLEELEEPRLKSKYFGFDNYQKIAGV